MQSTLFVDSIILLKFFLEILIIFLIHQKTVHQTHAAAVAAGDVVTDGRRREANVRGDGHPPGIVQGPVQLSFVELGEGPVAHVAG